MKTGFRLASIFTAVALLTAAQSAAPNPGRNYFTDTILIDHDGNPHRFYSDLLQGKVVIMNFMFASCKDSCPVMAQNFARIQDWLGGRLGKSVFLLSITVDSENDTPASLKAYATKVKAKPGWYFLTGSKENVNTVLRKLGQNVDQRDNHQSIFLMGNEPTGLWKKVKGMARQEEIIAVLDSVIEDPGEKH
jgi:protein SCO1/2